MPHFELCMQLLYIADWVAKTNGLTCLCGAPVNSIGKLASFPLLKLLLKMTIDSASEMIVCMLLNLVHWRLVALRSILCHPKVVEFEMGLLVAPMFMYEEAWLLF